MTCNLSARTPRRCPCAKSAYFFNPCQVKSVLAGLPRAASPIQAVNQPPPAEPAAPEVEAAPAAPAAPVAPAAPEGGGIVLPRVG